MTWVDSAIAVGSAIRGALPDTAWAAAIGASTTLIATWITGRRSERHLKLQLAHDSQQKEAARLLQLRRDIYLPLTEDLVSLTHVLGSVLDVKHEFPIAAIQRAAGTTAKIQMVASEGVLKAVSRLYNEINASITALVRLRIPLQLLNQQLDSENALYERLAREQTELVEMMKRYNLHGERDPAKWKRIEAQVQIATRSIEQSGQNRTRLNGEILAEQSVLLSAGLGHLKQVAPLQVPALLAIRQELSIAPIDAAVFENELSNQLARAQAEIQKMIEHINSEIGESAARNR